MERSKLTPATRHSGGYLEGSACGRMIHRATVQDQKMVQNDSGRVKGGARIYKRFLPFVPLLNRAPWISLEAEDTARVLTEALTFSSEVFRKVAAQHVQDGLWGFVGSTSMVVEMDHQFGDNCIMAGKNTRVCDRFLLREHCAGLDLSRVVASEYLDSEIAGITSVCLFALTKSVHMRIGTTLQDTVEVAAIRAYGQVRGSVQKEHGGGGAPTGHLTHPRQMYLCFYIATAISKEMYDRRASRHPAESHRPTTVYRKTSKKQKVDKN